MHRTKVPVAAVGLLLMLLVVPATVAVAQEATPTIATSPFPLIPDSDLCSTTPRPIDEIVDAWVATPASEHVTRQAPPTETSVPLGRPADDAIVDEVIRTTLEYYSCLHAGGFARASGLVTDDVVAQYGPWPSSMTRTDVEDFVAAPVWQGPGEEPPLIVAITDAMQLEDGRVGAFVVTDLGDRESTVYLIFEQHGERWLMDDAIRFMWYLPPSGDD